MKQEIMSMSSPEPLYDQQVDGFGDRIRKFWSKYIYNGFFDLYNKGRGSISINENDELDNRIYDEYQHFNNEIDLIKEMEAEKLSNFEMTIDGLERLC